MDFFSDELWPAGSKTEVILGSFPNEAVQIHVLQYASSGKAQWTAVALSSEDTNYEVIVDYVKHRTDSVYSRSSTGEEANQSESHLVFLSGVGVRLRANVHTREAGLNITSLFGLGAAAKSNKLTGTLRFETIGLSGEEISSLIPLPSELSPESIMAALQAAAAIKAKMYDLSPENVVPQVVAYRPAFPFEERFYELEEGSEEDGGIASGNTGNGE